MAKNTKPTIRFKGFTDAWEQRKLGDIAEFNPKAEIPDVFEYVDLESVIGTEMVSHRQELKLTAPSRAQRLAKTGDLFYQMVRPYQKNNYLYEKSDKHYVFSTGYAQMRPHQDGYFLLCLVQNNNFVQIVLDNCTGTSYPAINANDLANIEVKYPFKSEEQVKIGMVFRSLDNLITLHQRKYDSLVNVKKAMLEKMFPKNGETVPEIRFKGFTDAWEQRKLGEIAPLRGGYAFQSNNFLEEGIPIVKISNILSTGEVAGEFSFYEELDNDTNFILPDKAAVLAMSGATTGKVSILSNPSNIKFYQNQRVGYFKKTDGINYPFISTLVRSQVFNNQLNSILVTGAQPNVSSKDIDDFDVLIPASYKEQKKIGAYFSNLDHLITLHQRKLEKLKNIKKSCLEKMFV